MNNSRKALRRTLLCSIVAVVILIAAVVSVAGTYKKKNKVDPTGEVVKVWDGETKTAPIGSGTKDDPYIIASPDNLAYMSTEMDLTKFEYFSLIADLNMGGYDFTPIGNGANELTGFFYGNGYKITNIGEDEEGYYSSSKVQAPSLFGVVGAVDISDLTVEYAFDKAVDTAGFGGIAMISTGYTRISRCANITEKIEFVDCYAGYQAYGGIVGRTRGNLLIENCYSLTDMTFSGTSRAIGGLLGYCDAGGNVIRNSYTAGLIQALSGSRLSVGNIVGFGYNESPSLTLCILENVYSIYDNLGSYTNPSDKWSVLLNSGDWTMDPEINGGLPFLKIVEEEKVSEPSRDGEYEGEEAYTSESEYETVTETETVSTGTYTGYIVTYRVEYEYEYECLWTWTLNDAYDPDDSSGTESRGFWTLSSREWLETYSTKTEVGRSYYDNTPDDDTTYYYVSVTYDANGGTVNSSSTYTKSYTWSSKVNGWTSSSLVTPDARTNYTFDGWYDSATGGNLYDAVSDFEVKDYSITLYAHWTNTVGDTILDSGNLTVGSSGDGTITVNFDPNGGYIVWDGVKYASLKVTYLYHDDGY